MYSVFLTEKMPLLKRLIQRFDDYEYVSCLGSDINGKSYRVATRQSSINESSVERGFVIKMYKDKLYREYSFDRLDESNFDEVVANINACNHIVHTYDPCDSKVLADEPLIKDFRRESNQLGYDDAKIMEILSEAMNNGMTDPRIINVIANFSTYEVSKCFVSKHRELTQNYSYYNVRGICVSREDDNMQYSFQASDGNDPKKILMQANCVVEKAKDIAIKLLKATSVVPGIYDVICHPSISGLIAHEAFGHGVEMDMFVKNRALAKDYIGEYVASPIVSMHDGAAAAENVASYFFDDDGVLAHDTLIIDKGILKTGISDALSASVLNTEPTGNGRRESFSHKAYSRMTNTYFSAGNDNLEDMIASIKHGYILHDTNNGMEDPKNWGIQCTACYGEEIVDGKLTGNLIAPVIISGYVPDLLKSISMVSKEIELDGNGSCGKGYKEWVRVSDGGPYLKARVKLG